MRWAMNPKPVTHDVKKMLAIDGIKRCTQVQQDQSADFTFVDGSQYLINDTD